MSRKRKTTKKNQAAIEQNLSAAEIDYLASIRNTEAQLRERLRQMSQARTVALQLILKQRGIDQGTWNLDGTGTKLVKTSDQETKDN